ncbi:ribonuclease domain-containing protein [Deinococcus planocerae]|uniref:ribonuclease domain-containing protein n=1 Tax=Deinococcus planocerae TaxID=1737569 RepID=UPI000C7F18E8|nr:ribonuclease [Deinococcus planocerae]
MSLPAPLRFLRPVVLGALLLGCSPPGSGQDSGAQLQTARTTTQPPRDPQSGLPFVAAQGLPREARRTLTLIRAGGPFPHAKDGSTFGNREGLLPRRNRGYYREYTVPTPGENDRGARRIVCGGQTRSVGECYYTGDHYSSFRRILP